MSDSNLFLNKTVSGSNTTNTGNDKMSNGQNLLKNLKNSATSLITSSAKRNLLPTDNSDVYHEDDVSLSNRGVDAITGILSNTFNGNLFDAGVSAVQLYNYGTKWKIAQTTEVDMNIYPFKYNYLYDKGGNTGGNTGAITDEDKKIDSGFLDSIEDPTILGFTLKIDTTNSPLFANIIETKTNSGDGGVQAEEGTKSDRPNTIVKEGAYSATNFLNRYKRLYPEMNYCIDYLTEFTKIVKTIFTAPENNPLAQASSTKNKNYYIFSIKGLKQLDNRFVEYKDNDKEHEALEFVLGEDIRMYVNRMVFLYKNLTWSYNMGKKLIPENLLRFDMYIKVSDIRNFTNNTKDKNTDNEDDDLLTDAIRNGYSQMIYELKDCEFLFNDSSLNPDNLIVGGFAGNNDTPAEMTLKIKYRKVNRIFYSKLYKSDYSPNIIGDKLYKPNIQKTETDALNMFKPNKSKSINNNIPVYTSLASQLDVAKNKGLLAEKNDTSALGKFGISIGNKAIKAGASIVDDGVQSLKKSVNDFGQKATNNNLSRGIRDLLAVNVNLKSNRLDKNKDVIKDLNGVDKNNIVFNITEPRTGGLRDVEIINNDGSKVNADSIYSQEDIDKIPKLSEPRTKDLRDVVVEYDIKGIKKKINVDSIYSQEDIDNISKLSEPRTAGLRDVEIINNDGSKVKADSIYSQEDIDMIPNGIDVPNIKFDNNGTPIKSPNITFDNKDSVIQNPNKTFDNKGKNIENPNTVFDNKGKNIENPNEIFDNKGKNIEIPNTIFDNKGKSIQSPNERFDNKGSAIQNPNTVFDNKGSNIEAPKATLFHGLGDIVLQPSSDNNIENIENTIQEPNGNIENKVSNIEAPNSVFEQKESVVEAPKQIIYNDIDKEIKAPTNDNFTKFIKKIIEPTNNDFLDGLSNK